MNFVYLVESGRYERKELEKEQKAFIAGMEYVKDYVLDNFSTEDKLTLEEESSILDKIVAQERLRV